MSSLVQDLRYALRTLRNSPGFTAVAILTLALGIGANTAIFSFVEAMVLRPLPYEYADRIMSVLEKPPGGGRNGISTLNFLDWQRDNTVFDFMTAIRGETMTLSGMNQPVVLRSVRVSPHYFDIFSIKPVMGRAFLPEEDQPGKDHVVMLAHVLWENQFGADPAIIGRSVLLDGQPYTVVGVLPRGGVFDRDYSQLWRPLTFEPSNMTRDYHWFSAFARLKSGVTFKEAEAQMDAIGARLATEYPESNKGWGVSIERYGITGREELTYLYMLMTATAMVLLIGCANLANLALARGVSREREVAVRAAMGAGRWRLIRQFLTENVLLSTCGGVLGIGIGYATMRWLKALLPPYELPREIDVTMDTRVLMFALAISVMTGLVFGLAPALQATTPDLAGSMKEGGRGATAGSSRRRLRDVLVVGEMALAFVLLVGAGLLIRSFFRTLAVDTGFDSTNVLTMGLPVAQKRFSDPLQFNAYLREVRAAVEAVPGVRETAVTSALPMQGWGYGMPMLVAGRPFVDRANRQGGFFKIVSPSYFHTLGIKLIRGRTLTEHDAKGAPPVTVINQTLAQQYFAKEDPLGQRILIQEIVPGKTELGTEIPWEVVGVIADEKINDLTDEKSGGVYVSNEQSPAYGVSLLVRAVLNPATLQKSISLAIAGVNKDQALSDVRTLEKIKDDSVVGDRTGTMLMTIFAVVALLLSAIGIYGVISYSVAQRTHEMGIRAALGASTGDLLRLVLMNGLMLALLGLGIGVAGALALTRVLATILYGVGPRDPLTMVTVGAILAGVALIACFIPAQRATKVDPMVALRHE